MLYIIIKLLIVVVFMKYSYYYKMLIIVSGILQTTQDPMANLEIFRQGTYKFHNMNYN